MKRIITLLLVALILIVACPVSAEGITVNITSVKIGDVYSVGSVVPLTVETNESMVSRVDYYANGVKIPGTSTEPGKPVLWTPEVPGTYALTAKVFSVADTVIGSLSSAVTVTIEDPAIQYLVKADKTADVSNVVYSTNNLTPAATSTDYKKISNLSTVMGPFSSHKYFYMCDLGADIGTTSARKYTYINYSVYSNHDISVRSTLTDSKSVSSTTCWVSFKQGWNTVSVSINDSYRGTTLSDINIINFMADGGYTISSGFINAGTGLNAQPNYADTSLYFDAVWLSKEAVAKPQVVKTSIPDGQQNVCNGLGKYSITFDQEMLASTLKKENVTVKDSEDNEVTVTGVRVSGKTMELFFPGNSFAYNGVYTVSLNKNIESAKGISIGEGISFDFKIVNSCVNAQPIPSMTYPGNGAVVASNNALVAAKVIFDGKVNQVAFYEESGETDTLLSGTPKEGSDNEYYLNVSDFEIGEHTIYAKVTYNNSADTVLSAPVTFTVAEAEVYALTGISANEKIAVNFGDQIVSNRTVGLNTTEKVAKVTYYIDDVEKATVTTEPFTWDMPIADVNEHTITATVVDAMGSVQSLPKITFKASYLVPNNVMTDDYDESITGLTNQASGGSLKSVMTFVEDPATTNKRDGKVAFIDYTGSYASSNDDSCFVKGFTIPESMQVRIDLDMYLADTDHKNIYMNIRPDTYSYVGISGYNVKSYFGYYKLNEWNKVSVLIDFSQSDKTSFKSYVNGVLVQDTTQNGTQFHRTANKKYVIHLMSQADYYIDNLLVYEYAYSTLDVPTVGNVSCVADEEGWDASFNVVNFGSDATECILYTAVYDDDDNLISVSGEFVPMAAGAIVNKSYRCSKTNGDKTGTKIRGFVWESVSGITTLRPLGNLK